MQPQKKKVVASKPVIKLKQAKKQLCRFYLRGLCIYKASECINSHGVWDLHYQPYKQGQQIIYDYSKIDKACRQLSQKVQRSYKILYDYQIQKIFTLQQLNSDRQKRQLIRNQMHSDMFNQFMDLLSCYYPETLFTQQFLLREFSRVGFNKTMSVIKLTHICSFVCDPPGSRFFKINLLMPPLLTKETTYILPCCSDQENFGFYKNCYEEFVEKAKSQNNVEELTEANIKKYLFGVVRNKINLLPLNIYLKNKKMSFNNFLKLLNGQENAENPIILEVDQKTLLASSAKYIQEKVQNGDGWSTWSDVFKYIAQQFKVNNANITNPLKPILIQDGYMFLCFPMIQFITSQKRMNTWSNNQTQQSFEKIVENKELTKQNNKQEDNESKTKNNNSNHCQTTQKCRYPSVCQCSFKDMYPQQQLMLNLLSLEQQEQLPPKQSFDVYNLESLLKCAKNLLQAKVIGVDLQGRLRRNGYIEMIQINTGINTFLIDIQEILKNGEIETFELCKKVLRNVFCNPKILKIFHDCRHDTLVLHQIMNTCVINIFDTSAVQTLRGQLQAYQNIKNNNLILKTIGNVKTPGYNDLLKKYNAPHGINKNKEWFHELWRKGHTQLFEKRPLDPEYRDYCIKDVLDLPYLQQAMSKDLNSNFTNWLSSHYVGQGYLYTIEQ